MSNKNKYSYEEKNTWIVHEIENDDISKSILEKFYKRIAENSRNTYASHLRTICRKADKTSFSELNYNDYKTVIQDREYARIHIETFFKFLYAFNYLKDESGFNNLYWIKEKIKEEYYEKINKFSNDNHANNQSYDNIISLDELDKLLDFYNEVSVEDVPNMKISFCFYALFFIGLPAEELKKLSKEQIDSGCIITKSDEYLINERFWKFLSDLPEDEYSFGQVNEYISKLCQSVSIKKLTPRDFKKAHKQYTFCCPQCGENYLSFSNNWQVVNKQIICNDCAEILNNEFQSKKNYIFEELNSINIETVSQEEHENTSIILSDFAKLKNNIPKVKDYTGINKFLKYIGDLGEKYVLEYEQKRLKNSSSRYWELVDGSFALDNKNGFDILSYTENGKEIYIEVKTTTGNVSESFYMSKNEYDTAKEIINRGDCYKLYRVGNIFSDNISLAIYDNIDNVSLDSVVYKVTIDGNKNGQ